MRARNLLLTGMGLSLLAVGCGTEPLADPRPRQRFEVMPDGVRPADGDREAAASPRRPRPDPVAADPVDTGAAAPSDPSAPPARDVDGVRRRVQAQARALEAARTAGAPADAAPPPAPPTLPTGPAPDGGPGVEWLAPDAAARPPAPRVRPPATRPAVRPAPVPDEGGAPDNDGAANQGTQVAPPPAPAPALPFPATAPFAGGAPVFPSQHAGVTLSASTDPDPLGSRVGQRMRDYPTDLAAHLDYQMLRFLREEPAPQLEALSTLSGEDREVLTALMDGLSNFRNGLHADRNMLLSQKVRPILDLADRIRSQAELTIPTIAVCSRVQGFGVYDPMPGNLKAGTDNPLIIYCEVQNFSSQQNDKAMWETKLSQEAVLYMETGLAVWRDKSDIPVDLSRNRRHDFFVVKKVTLPRALGVGRYVLKVTIVDEQVRRVAENSVPLLVLAQ